MIVIIFPPFSQIRSIFCQCMNLRSTVCCGARLSFCHYNLLALYVWWMDEKKTKNFAVILFPLSRLKLNLIRYQGKLLRCLLIASTREVVISGG